MKICMLTYRGNPFCGGQGIYITALTKALVQAGHEVHCISGPPYPRREEGVHWHFVPGLFFQGQNGDGSPRSSVFSAFSPLNMLERLASGAGVFPEMTTFSLRAFHKVWELLARHRFDVIHDNQSLGWGLLPLKKLGLPVLATIHHPLTVDRSRGFEPPTSFRRQWAQTLFYPIGMQGTVARRMDHVITVSQASAARIVADFRLSPEAITVVPNGVDTDRFRPLSAVRPVPGRVLFVGNITDPNKGGRYLLEAMARLPPPAHLCIVTGAIPQDQWFHNALAAPELRGRVRLRYGLSAEALVRSYAKAQVAVSPSLFEGFGFPAAEAMACGLPLVAARGGALPEVVGAAGLLVPPRDSLALAKACERLFADAPLRKRLGRAGRLRVKRHFCWRRAAAQLTAVYERVCRAHRRF